jgi:hypothetical protein
VLPDEVVARTAATYREAQRLLTSTRVDVPHSENL